MMATDVVGQALEHNTDHWMRPVRRDDPAATWPGEHGFACEDWNFAIDQRLDGFVYGFGQGRLGEQRRRAANDLFDVVFYTYEHDGNGSIVGLYRDATFIPEEARADVWRRLAEADIIARRFRDLAEALGRDPSRLALAINHYATCHAVCWRVPVERVTVFDPGRPIVVGNDWRHTNAHRWGTDVDSVLTHGLPD